MHNEKYQARKVKSEAMIEAGVSPVIDGFNEYLIPSKSEQRKNEETVITAIDLYMKGVAYR